MPDSGQQRASDERELLGMSEAAGQEPIQIDEDFAQDPHALYRRLRPGGSAHPVTFPNGWPGWLVTSYEDARRLLADPRLSKDLARGVALFPPGTAGSYASPLQANMLNSDPPDHTRLRRLVGKAFTGRTVERLRPRIMQAADELLDAIPAQSTVDLIDAYALPLPIIVICELLGVPAADRTDFRGWTLTFVTKSTPEQIVAATQAISAYLNRLIDEKTASPGDDLLSELIQASDEGSSLSRHELLLMAFALLIAGFETTVNLIANGVLALLRHPDQLALLHADQSLLPGAIEEMLRFDGPADVATLRFTTEPVRVGETEIPVDQLVHISLLAANRDGDRFTDPDKFDITRAAAGHVAFGHGVHHCVGAPLARLEGQIAIGQLLSRFPDIVLDTDPGSLRYRPSTSMHGLQSLPVRVNS
jgi:cytochrome P450